MDAGHDINKLDASQETPLHDAISSGECLEFCFMSVNIFPYIFTCYRCPSFTNIKTYFTGSLNCAKFLIALPGIDLNAGHTPIREFVDKLFPEYEALFEYLPIPAKTVVSPVGETSG